MNASMQYQIEAADLALLLALTRAGTLATTAARLAVDSSTVFRSLNRIEKGLGQRLFERSRSGLRPTDLAIELIQHAERIEAELEAARSASSARAGQVSGSVRITTTDTVLYGLVMPSLPALGKAHPLLQVELVAGNELANLTRRDADIALRATQRPPEHLIGRRLGPIRVAVFGPKAMGTPKSGSIDFSTQSWIAPDDALPEHPSVRWRQRHHPKAVVRWRVSSIHAVLEGIRLGLGVGTVPLFMARGRKDVRQLTAPLDDAETALWLLTHPESRHLRRISVVFSHLAQSIALD